jgi:hypothetical protein
MDRTVAAPSSRPTTDAQDGTPAAPATDDSARPLPPAWEAAVVIGAFLFLTCVLTYPLVWQIGRSTLDTGDSLFNGWVLGWVSDRLGHGGAGLFDAPILYPYAYTLAYSESLLGIAIFVAPVYWLTGNTLLTHNVAVVFSFVLAGSGMYLLARSLTGRRDAAMIAALAFAFCPYRRVQIPIVQMLMSGWLPIAIWTLRGYFQTGRRVWLGGFVAAVVVQSLTSVYFPFFLAIPILVVVAAELLRGALPARRAVLDLAMACGLVVAMLAPLARMHQLALRGQDSVAAAVPSHVAYGADLASYLHVDPRIVVYRRIGTDPGSEGNLFPGATVLLLAALALWPSRRQHPADGRGRLRLLLGPRTQLAIIAAIALALSLGPRPSVFGHVILERGPFAWLAAWTPGLGALRVPARFGMVVHLALAALAAFGAARLLGWMRPSRAMVVAVALAAAVTVEGYGAPLPMQRLAQAGSMGHRQAWRWLRAQPPRPIVEMPVLDMAFPDHHARDVQDGTLVHGRKLINGSSRFGSEIQNLLGSEGSPLRDPAQFRDAFAFLQQLKVGDVLVHPDWYGDRGIAQATLDYMDATPDQFAERKYFGGTFVYRLRPGAALPAVDRSHPLPAGAYRLTSSHDATHLPLLSDGDLLTGWKTFEPQRGGEWIALDFPQVTDVAAVRLELRAFRLREYPRQLVIESSPDGRDFTPLFSGSVLPHIGAALLADTRRIAVDVPLAANRTRVLRIRQVGATPAWQWALQELTPWVRDGAGPAD